MSSEPRARGHTLVRNLASAKLATLSVLALAALTACIGGPPRPTTPAYSGAMRPDPTRPARPGEPVPTGIISERYADSRNAYMPRHIPRNEAQNIKRVAVLLPFNDTRPEVQRLTRGLYNSIQMALFEIGARDVVLMPRDASNADPRETARIAEDAVKDGAIAVIGPLFAQQVAAVAGKAAEVRAPVLAFSNDVAAVGQGAYLVSLTPKSEVERIVDWATTQGVTRFVMFGPNTDYGHTIEAALREEAAERGAQVVGVEYYPPGNSSPQNEASRLSTIIEAENKANPGKVAVLIPEQGVQLRSVGSLLRSISDVTPKDVRFLGTGMWNDPEVWRETALYGGAFPAPDPEAQSNFERRYLATFGEAAPKVASYGYDAGALAATLANSERLDAAMIQRAQGWGGVNGLFRFQPDGSVERALAVLQLQSQGGVRVISPPIKQFGPGS
jgi:branched-chain amino acid transport system substrate-binding protein